MSYKNQYKGRRVHTQSELEQICESQYETIRLLLQLVQTCDKGFKDIKEFDDDLEENFDDPGQMAGTYRKIINRKLSEL